MINGGKIEIKTSPKTTILTKGETRAIIMGISTIGVDNGTIIQINGEIEIKMTMADTTIAEII